MADNNNKAIKIHRSKVVTKGTPPEDKINKPLPYIKNKNKEKLETRPSNKVSNNNSPFNKAETIDSGNSYEKARIDIPDSAQVQTVAYEKRGKLIDNPDAAQDQTNMNNKAKKIRGVRKL